MDSAYRFTYIDVGAIGSESDGGVFAQTQFSRMLARQEASLPQPEPLAPGGEPVDYFLVGDDAFPLRNYLMKPFPLRGLTKEERIFNYRLSRARRIVENAFGILANRFRVLHTTMCMRPERAECVVMAACILHNILRNRDPSLQEADHEDTVTHEVIPGAWRVDANVGTNLPTLPGHTATSTAKAQRIILRDYFSSPAGSVPWQENMI